MPGSNIQDHFRDKERIETGSAVAFCEIDDLILETDEPADTAGKNYADTVGVDPFLVDPGVPDGFVAGSHGDLGITVNLTGFFLIEVIEWIETFQLAGKSCFELRSIEKGYSFSTGNAIEQCLPIVLRIVTDRCEGPNARDDNSFQLHSGSFPGF